MERQSKEQPQPDEQQPALVSAPVNPQGEYEVEAITKKEFRGGQPFYLVAWRGYSKNERTWEPLCNLANCMPLVELFEQSLTQDLKSTEPSLSIGTRKVGAEKGVLRIIGTFWDKEKEKHCYAVEYKSQKGERVPKVEIVESEDLEKECPKVLISYLENQIAKPII